MLPAVESYPVHCVTGADTYHYTNENHNCEDENMFFLYKGNLTITEKITPCTQQESNPVSHVTGRHAYHYTAKYYNCEDEKCVIC